ncbi:hypothetical protein GCM10007874_60660 [Labrys miyagiensis]|uniref:DUF937 domain-containing protein n=1 Tax=Labrys miyagiensis TaxID=346912 RepID=A0ABQ6CXU5_9HYPH|nr:DUF937 domain-containing protein [Labrys miyagiensis]GLS23046.1 hypothetical protein GCM10007874_60660 [Labrys miyagiensis]
MAINLPSLVSQLITPDLINRIAAAVGIDPALAQKLVNAAIPAVLGAFASEASNPDGAKSISDLISNQDPNMLDNLISGLKSGNAGALASGAGVLSSLLGNEGLGQLSSVLGQATGASQQAASSVLGLVGPAVVGAISNQSPENWQDGAAVANLFEGEKKAIASALPASLAAALNDSGFLQGFESAVSGAFKTTTSTLGSAAGAATSTLNPQPVPPRVQPTPSAPPPAQPSGGSMTWLYLVIAIVIVAGIAWYIWHKRQEAAPAPASSGQIETPVSPTSLG